MNRLGYSRYVAQGGDQGASVTDAMGRHAPDGLLGIHLNLLTAFPTDVGAALFGGLIPAGLFKPGCNRRPRPPRPQEGARDAGCGRRALQKGYFVEMPEHPQTIGSALADTPLGLAAWMLDHDPDSYTKISRAFLDGNPSGGLTRDKIVDNITLYWLTNTATSSARLYWEQFRVIFGAIASGAARALARSPSVFPARSSRRRAATRRSTPTSSTSTRPNAAGTSRHGRARDLRPGTPTRSAAARRSST